MSNRSITFYTCKIIWRKPSKEATAHQIMEELGIKYEMYPTDASLRVLLSTMKRRGYLTSRSAPCPCCMKPVTLYSITDTALSKFGYDLRS